MTAARRFPTFASALCALAFSCALLTPCAAYADVSGNSSFSDSGSVKISYTVDSGKEIQTVTVDKEMAGAAPSAAPGTARAALPRTGNAASSDYARTGEGATLLCAAMAAVALAAIGFALMGSRRETRE